MKKLKILMVASAATMLSSCDLSQIPGLTGKLSIEDSKAVGAACRHSGRALEDCFTMNPKTYQSGVFDGWRDMNDYMLANEIDVVKPEIRTSAYQPDKISMEPPAQVAGGAPGSVSAGAPVGEAVPLAQGRQRWQPKGLKEPSVGAPSAKPSATQAGEDEENAAEMAPAIGEAEVPAKAESALEAPARPWERKKDPKKHT